VHINLKIFFYCLLPIFLLVSSCQNKTQKLIAKKWDCIQVENLAQIDKNISNPKDSIIAVQTEAALKALSWTFSSNQTYQCSIGERTTTQGTYEITPDEKTITLTSVTKNSVNSYLITSLSEFELTLMSTGTNVPLILHFRPH
jgi:Lipocalin-like domain (DUF4923)